MPGEITGGLYTDFEYQIGTVKMVIDRLSRYDGVLFADVVGLGKSIIASCVAHNMDLKIVIIAPPHRMTQWEEYKEQFSIRGSKVFNSGKIHEVYRYCQESKESILVVLDGSLSLSK